jgi:hypothetical protein
MLRSAPYLWHGRAGLHAIGEYLSFVFVVLSPLASCIILASGDARTHRKNDFSKNEMLPVDKYLDVNQRYWLTNPYGLVPTDPDAEYY